MAEPVKIENPSEGSEFSAPQFDRHQEGPQNSAALRLSKPSKCRSWVRANTLEEAEARYGRYTEEHDTKIAAEIEQQPDKPRVHAVGNMR